MVFTIIIITPYGAKVNNTIQSYDILKQTKLKGEICIFITELEI